jgi:hypothetical protein
MANKEPVQKVTMNLPVSLVKQAKHYAVDADLDLQAVVAEALRVFLARKAGAR